MKITATILFVFSLHVAAKSVSQTITLSGKNIPLKTVFFEIQKQSGFLVVYNKEQIKGLKSITTDVKEYPLLEFLDETFTTQGLEYIIENKTIIIKVKTAKEEFADHNRKAPPVTGIVRGPDGLPLAGASVKITGTSIGTKTDNQGNFIINSVDENATLEISYVGHETQVIAVRGKTSLVITLRQTNALLDKTVVIAYGRESKRNITSSVASVTGEEIKRAPVANISNALLGNLPGLIAFNNNGQPGNDDATLLVRGLSTLGDNSPLIVIDGIPRASFSYMDPNDIEAISLLKDAAAVSLYGARSANGVILITTKRGSAGKSSITYTGNWGLQHPTSLIKSLDSYNTSLLWNEAHKNEQTFSPSPGGVNGYDDATLEIIKNGSDPDRYANDDWYKTIFDKYRSQTMHNLSITGGGNNVRYFISGGFLDQKGLYPAAYLKRYNFRANIDGTITRDLDFAVNLSGRVENSDGFYTYLYTNFGQFGYGNGIVTASLYTPNIEPIKYQNGTYHYSDFSAGNMYLNSIGEGGYNKTNNNILENSIALNYHLPFIKGLTAKGLIALDKSFLFKKSLNKPYTSYVLNTDGSFTAVQNTQTTSVSESYFQTQSITAEFSVNYERAWDQHNLKTLLMYSQTQNKGDNLSAQRSGLPSASLDQLDLGNSNTATNGGSGFQNARQSIIGRAAYNFRNKYLADFSFRYDGSDVFPLHHRFGFFPALSVGWILSQENFLKQYGFIDFMKLRGSYGHAGNDRVGEFQYLQTYAASGVYAFGGTSVQALVPGGIPNPDFTWERAVISDVGLEANFLKNKFTLEADVFYKKTKDILVPPVNAIPAVLGGTPPLQNNGIVSSKGIELTLGYRQQFGNLNFSIRPSITLTHNKVLFYPEPAGIPDYLKITGQPVSVDALIGYHALGLYKTPDQIAKGPAPLYENVQPGDIQYEDVNSDGRIDASDRVIITRGSTPGKIYSMNVNATYKNIELNFLFQGASDAHTYLAPEINASFYAGVIQKAYAYQLDRWTPENSDATYPRMTVTSQNNREQSSFWVRNSSFFRLKNAEIAYSLPRKATSKMGTTGLRVYLNASNLFTFSKMKIADPETGGSAIAYPLLKLYNLGVSLSF